MQYTDYAIFFIIWEVLILTGVSKNFLKSITDGEKNLFAFLSLMSWFLILIGYIIWSVVGATAPKLSGDKYIYFILLILSSFLTIFIITNKDIKIKVDAIISIIFLIIILTF